MRTDRNTHAEYSDRARKELERFSDSAVVLDRVVEDMVPRLQAVLRHARHSQVLLGAVYNRGIDGIRFPVQSGKSPYADAPITYESLEEIQRDVDELLDTAGFRTLLDEGGRRFAVTAVLLFEQQQDAV